MIQGQLEGTSRPGMAAIRRRALPACLAFLAGCASRPAIEGPADAVAVDWSRAERLEIVLEDYRFAPETLRLRANKPYVLALTNRGGKTHDFTAPAFFRSAATRDRDPAATAMRAAGGRVDVGAGATVEIAVMPLTPGSFPLECVKPLHAMFGMAGEIVVAA